MENNVRPSYMQPEEIIKAENLKKYYTVGGSGFFAPKSKTLHALDGVDITKVKSLVWLVKAAVVKVPWEDVCSDL
ncbi:MAG: hypothetical protein RR263_03875 [Oscillospiraceae bacterium]